MNWVNMCLVAQSVQFCHCHQLPQKKRFTQFMRDHPQPIDANFICKARKAKADGTCISIFPKLLSMVKASYNRWKQNLAIKASQDNVGPAALELFETPLKKSISAEEHHGSDIFKQKRCRY